MGAQVRYFWRPYLERGLTRETFANNECDVLLDMPADSRSVLTSLPIYRSTYVLAYKSDRNYDFKGFDDPRLKELKVGTYQHSAIRIALADYGLKNLEFVKTVTSDADLEPENQPWRQAQDVIDGKLDVVGIWGPFAGWLKTMKHEPITLQPVNLMDDKVPLEFSLAIGVQNTDVVLKFMIDNALRKKHDEIGAILRDYGVPLVQCSDCIVSGDLPSHGSYDKVIAKKYEDRFLKSAEAGAGNAGSGARSGRVAEAARRLARRGRRRKRGAQQRRAGLRQGPRDVPALKGRRHQQARQPGLHAALDRGPQPQFRTRPASAGARGRPESPRQ